MHASRRSSLLLPAAAQVARSSAVLASRCVGVVFTATDSPCKTQGGFMHAIVPCVGGSRHSSRQLAHLRGPQSSVLLSCRHACRHEHDEQFLRLDFADMSKNRAVAVLSSSPARFLHLPTLSLPVSVLVGFCSPSLYMILNAYAHSPYVSNFERLCQYISKLTKSL